MDKQLIFFLMLAFLFLIKGVASINPIMQLAGISLLLVLIYEKLFNDEENKKYEKNYVKGINFIAFLGYVDLILGVLLLIRSVYGIIPVALLVFLAMILFLKAFVFVWGGDVASMMDIISAMIIFSYAVIAMPAFIGIGISIYLIQKGVFSFFSQ